MKEETFEEIGKIAAIDNLKALFKSQENIYSDCHHSIMMLEGIDFDLSYFPLKHLGYKTVTAITGEIYASLSEPQSLSVNIGVSAKLDYPQIKELWEGIVFAAQEYGYKRVELDIQASKTGLIISLSATGKTIPDLIKNKAQFQTKDLICISDNLGGAYFGLRLLEKYKTSTQTDDNHKQLEKHSMMIASYLKPKINPNIIKFLKEDNIFPSSAFCVSKGLADTVKRIGKLSNLGLKIYANKIPFEGNSFDLGKELDIDPISAAMNGGEDYRILFTIPILEFEKFRRTFSSFDVIGHLALKEIGEVLVTPEGLELPIQAQGWENFNY